MALVGWWMLNEGTGTSIADDSGNTNTGTLNGGTWLATGSRTGGPCLLFDGNAQRVRIPDHSTLDISSYTDWTMGAWVYPVAITGTEYPAVYAYGLAGATLGFSDLEAGTDGRIEHWRNNTTSLHSTSAIALTTWQHIAVTRNATTTTFYMNGVANGTGSSTSITTDTTGTGIGGLQGGIVDSGFNGRVSDVRLYSHVLTQTEINDWAGIATAGTKGRLLLLGVG